MIRHKLLKIPTKAIEELESKIRNDNTLDSMFRLMYNQYVDELEGDEAIDFVQYRESAINNLINNTYILKFLILLIRNYLILETRF